MIATMIKSPTPTEQDPRWNRVVTRDAAADGCFVYAVKTTGVYCRPSCASRGAKPQNVCFYATPVDAEAAGFRACLRCNPNGPSRASTNAKIIAKACRFIEVSEVLPALDTLAASAGMSRYHFHRQFKAITGLTPRAYGAAYRASKVRAEIADTANNITEAIYSAGYSSNSRFYERSDDILGMTPTAYRQGGDSTVIHFAVGTCSLGAIVVARTAKGICAITIGDDPEILVQDLQDRFPHATLIGGDRDFEHWVAQVVGLIESPKLGFDLPLDLRGTAFQLRVWEALRRIPAGETISYTDLARRVGAPKSVRAVAGACAANKIAVAIPCHRVVRTDGSLSGYRWGVQRKRALLDRETAR